MLAVILAQAAEAQAVEEVRMSGPGLLVAILGMACFAVLFLAVMVFVIFKLVQRLHTPGVSQRWCSNCGAPLTADSPQGLCPACLPKP
jgi:hypothetical protein